MATASTLASSSSSGDRAKSDALAEEQRAQTMMYAARMTYLQDSDQVQPDTLFLTRKQAQKLARQDTIAMLSLRKLDMNSGKLNGGGVGAGGGGIGGGGATGAGGAGGADTKGGGGCQGNALANWKKPRGGFPTLDDTQQTWVAVTQAGCHFWQSQETGECRTAAPGGWKRQRHPHERKGSDDDDDELDEDAELHSGNEDEDDARFPDAFAFLNDRRRPH